MTFPIIEPSNAVRATFVLPWVFVMHVMTEYPLGNGCNKKSLKFSSENVAVVFGRSDVVG